MPRFLVQVKSVAWGTGKTDAVGTVAAWIQQDAGMRVGGFSLRRNNFWQADGSKQHEGYLAQLHSTGEHLEIARGDRPEWFHNDPSEYRTDAPDGRQVFHVNLEAVEQLVAHCRRDLEDPTIPVMVFDEMGPILTRGPSRKRRRGKMVKDLLEDLIESDKTLAIVVYSDVHQKDRETSTAKWREESQALGVARIHMDFTITQSNYRTLSCVISKRIRDEVPEFASVSSIAPPT